MERGQTYEENTGTYEIKNVISKVNILWTPHRVGGPHTVSRKQKVKILEPQGLWFP